MINVLYLHSPRMDRKIRQLIDDAVPDEIFINKYHMLSMEQLLEMLSRSI